MTTTPPRRPSSTNDDETPRLSALVDSLIATALVQGSLPPATIVAVRYVLAILATDAHGDACRFPRCACPIMDCSRQPSGTPPSR